MDFINLHLIISLFKSSLSTFFQGKEPTTTHGDVVVATTPGEGGRPCACLSLLPRVPRRKRGREGSRAGGEKEGEREKGRERGEQDEQEQVETDAGVAEATFIL